jgi:hypothetical protein
METSGRDGYPFFYQNNWDRSFAVPQALYCCYILKILVQDGIV